MSLSETWCRTYTLLVPEQEAVRRRAEVASHVYEARAAGVPRSRLALQGVVGAGADLVWSDRVRRRRGLVPLVAVPLQDRAVGAIVAGLLVLLSFLVTVLPRHPITTLLAETTAYLALVAVCSGHVTALTRHLRRRRRGR